MSEAESTLAQELRQLSREIRERIETHEVDEAQRELGVLDRLREAWKSVGAELLAGPAVPGRREVLDAAHKVTLLAHPNETIADIARAFGASRRSVRDTMKRVGVYQAPPRPRHADICWDDEPDLGKVPDRVLAAKLGCPHGTVTMARRRRGIPAARRAKRGAS
jgi:hypothetical protein